ncbi:MAG: hypothetical protein Q8Q23_00975 [bacterium]|nr:hypothetical protein [bacterium]
MKQEVSLSIMFIALLIIILNPFHFWMPSMLTYTLLISLLVIFGVFAAFIWREKSNDERENLHKLMAGRFAFLVGVGILVVAVIIEDINSQIDIWLIIALGGMILAKVSGLLYGRLKH